MPDTYNEELILGSNPDAIHAISSIHHDELVAIVQEVAKTETTSAKIQEEFVDGFEGFDNDQKVTGEHIKSFFIMVLDGIPKILRVIRERYQAIASKIGNALYEDMWVFFQDLFDEINFDTLFLDEIKVLSCVGA